MSDDESDTDTSTSLVTRSPESGNGVAMKRAREEAEESSRRESRRSHIQFLAVLISAVVVLSVIVALGMGVGLTRSHQTTELPQDPFSRVEALLAEYPVIDGLVCS